MKGIKNIMPKAMAVQAQAAKIAAKPKIKTAVKAAAKPKAHNIKTKKK